ncbi:hypothetical protein [Streptomyces sp. KL118A]|uniref:hypothetical protein n=1 Tax=Streptomyces sp. KL118A TaxID=3045153 RepID=UPI00278BD2FF|nr:hypothetical protein [Streptomyces sp. KL118A]
MNETPVWLEGLADDAPGDGAWTRTEIAHGNFEVWCRFRVDSAATAPTHVVIRPAEGGDIAAQARGITTTVLRELNPAKEVRGFQQQRKELIEREKYPLSEQVDAHLRGSNRPTDPYLAALALRYERLAESGERSPVRKLMTITGRSLGTVKSHLQLARKKGFLEAVGSKAGGRATDKAKRAAAEAASTLPGEVLGE